MPDVFMKNFIRFSFLALASVCSIAGGPNKALSFPAGDTAEKIESKLASHTKESIDTNFTSFSGNESTYEFESNNELIASSQFEGITSSIGTRSDSFSDNTLADSSSVNSSQGQGYSGNSNPASYYWYRRNKNKGISPSAVKAAFTKRSNSFSTKFSETLSVLETSSTVSETLNTTFAPISKSGSSGIRPGFSTLSSSQTEVNSESMPGLSLLTSSFSQSF